MSSLSTVRQHPSFITDVSRQRLTLLDWNCIILLFIFLSFSFIILSIHRSPFCYPLYQFCHLFIHISNPSVPSFLPSILSFFLHDFIHFHNICTGTSYFAKSDFAESGKPENPQSRGNQHRRNSVYSHNEVSGMSS